MFVVADVSIATESFPAGRALSPSSEESIEFAQVVPLDDGLLPYLWYRGRDPGSFAATVSEAAAVEDIVRMGDAGRRVLFSVDWRPGNDPVVDAMLATDAVVVRGRVTTVDWHLKLRFPGRPALREFFAGASDQGAEVEVRRIADPSADDRSRDLSTEQHKALVVAFEQGYFDVPRDVTLTELGHILGISDQAVSQRLRRGLSSLVARTLVDEE